MTFFESKEADAIMCMGLKKDNGDIILAIKKDNTGYYLCFPADEVYIDTIIKQQKNEKI